MKLFSFISKERTSKIEDSDLEHAYELIDKIYNYIEHKDFLRASESYVELEKLYKELKVGKADVYDKCVELHHRLSERPKSPSIKLEVERVAGESSKEPRLSEELTKFKIDNETLRVEFKNLKKALATRDKVLEDLNKRNDNERKQFDEKIRELESKLKELNKIKENYEKEIKETKEKDEKDIKKTKEKYEEEIKHTRNMYEKEIKKIRDTYENKFEKLNLEIGKLEIKKGSVEKPMFFEFFARKKKMEEKKSKVDVDVDEESKVIEKSPIKKLLFFELFTKKKKPTEEKPKRSKVAEEVVEEVPETLPKLDFKKDIKVEEKETRDDEDHKSKWVKIGVPGLDNLIVNGIPKSSSILVAGGPGSGKTTLCLQTVAYGAKHGERCLYLTFEEEKKNLTRHMKNFGWDPEKLEKNGLLIIKKMDPFEISRNVEALLARASGELMIDINEIEGIIPAGFKPDRIVLDSLSAVAAAFSSKEEGYRIYIEQLFDLFKRIGATSFLITEVEQDTARYSRSGVEEFLADAVISLYNIRKGSVKVSAVEIIKIRGTNFKKKIVPFKMISKKGIEVYPQEEVFA